ncbi:MAG: hypothetical protein LRY38_01545 [Aeromonadaceae bacterium]|nr:hypothetical protein [Aeromonadaceae bacterium]
MGKAIFWSLMAFVMLFCASALTLVSAANWLPGSGETADLAWLVVAAALFGVLLLPKVYGAVVVFALQLLINLIAGALGLLAMGMKWILRYLTAWDTRLTRWQREMRG